MLERRLPAVAIALVVALTGLVPQFLSRTLPDVAFLLYAAGRVLDGARLYVDVIEINPPLIVWLNVPIVAAARLLGTSEILLYRIAVVGVLCAAIFVCRALLLRTTEGTSVSLRRLLLLGLIFILCVLPRLDWGEREHLTLALTLPYLLLAVIRLQGGALSRAGAAGIGVAAAVGIAIKPQFVLLWAVRELVVAVRTRRPTFEGLVVVGAGLAYIATTALAAPEYFSLVRELGPAYQHYLHNSLAITAFLGDGAALALGALLIAAGLWRRGTSPELRAVLVVAITAAYLAAVVQQKGWRYHFYPALSLGWLLLVVVSYRTATQPLFRWPERLFGAIARAAAATVVVAALAGALVQASRPLDPRYDADPSIGPLIAALEPNVRGRPLMVVSSNMASGFPLTTYTGAEWPQRFSNLWPLVAAYDSALRANGPFAYRPVAGMTPLERRLLTTVAEDFARAEPPVVAVLHPGPDHVKWGMRRLDLLEFLRRDRSFAQRFARYDSVGVVGQYAMFEAPGVDILPNPLPAAPTASSATQAPNEIAVTPESLLLAALFLALLGVSYRALRALPPRGMVGDVA